MPVTVLVMVVVPRVKVTTVLEPVSALTVTTPLVAKASAALAPSLTPVPRAKVGDTGAAVSKTKVVVPAALAFLAASVATALMLMVPSPNVVKSALLSTTATGLPVLVKVLVTVLAPLVKVTTVLAPLSAVTVTTPLAAKASALVAPLPMLTPVPNIKTGAVGASVSGAVDDPLEDEELEEETTKRPNKAKPTLAAVKPAAAGAPLAAAPPASVAVAVAAWANTTRSVDSWINAKFSPMLSIKAGTNKSANSAFTGSSGCSNKACSASSASRA